MHKNLLVPVFWLALLARLAVAILRFDMHWPDEHFQTLEPASKIIYGYGLMSWEWQEGFRSWIMPALLMPLFFVLKIFDVTGGLVPIISSRIFFAIASMAIVLGLDQLYARLKFSLLTRWLAALAVSFSVAMLLWAPATLSDTWVAALWWGLLPFIILNLEKSRGYLAGFLASLPFLFRFQTGILGAVFGLLVFSSKKYRPLTWSVFLGGLINMAFYGLVDWVTLGTPFLSLIRQLSEGIKKSEFYGVSPPWDYFNRIWQDLGAGLCLIMIAFFILAWIFRKPVQTSRWIWSVTILPVAVYGILHSFIPHKETRFIYIVYPALFLTFAWSIETLTYRLPERWKELKFPHPLIQILAVISIGLGSLFALKDHSLYLTPVDTAELLDRIYHEEKKEPATQTCVLFIENNWSFTRGSLGMGRQFAGVDRNFDQLSPKDFGECGWVIARTSTFPIVLNRAQAAGRKLDLVTETYSGFALYR